MTNKLKSVKRFLKNVARIFEGLKNRIFKKDYVEEIASSRMKICNGCSLIDVEGSGCMVPGTQPCCSSCGCNLSLKVRSLSSDCPLNKWQAVMTFEEEYMLNKKNIKGDD